MKENEAMKIIEQKMGRESKKSTIKAFEIALKALEEVQRYRGTDTRTDILYMTHGSVLAAESVMKLTMMSMIFVRIVARK